MILKELFEKNMWLKCQLLIEGCNIDLNVEFPPDISYKSIHLYSHSDEKITKIIPDDILIGDLPYQLAVRIRYREESKFKIFQNNKNYLLADGEGNEYPIDFIKCPKFRSFDDGVIKPGDVCSFLGQDLLGVIPSNYCFYFKDNIQCKFCEILPTFKSELSYKKTLKSTELMAEAIKKAQELDPFLKHLAVTTGNIKSYDWTADYLIELGRKLSDTSTIKAFDQVLATLMPPNEFSKIDSLYQSGYNKIYFPLEVFDREHFKFVCPGKEIYGYDAIISGLDKALNSFGKGNVYTNFVYGIQSLNSDLQPDSYDPLRENQLSLDAVEKMVSEKIIPAFTIYHYGGYNTIGNIDLNSRSTFDFFKEWGNIVYNSQIISPKQETVLFSLLSLSNTLFNEGFLLAKLNQENFTEVPNQTLEKIYVE